MGWEQCFKQCGEIPENEIINLKNNWDKISNLRANYRKNLKESFNRFIKTE